MSEFPGPTRENACIELFDTIKKCYNNTGPGAQYIRLRSNDYINYIIKKEVYKYEEGDLGSETGWILFFRKDLLNSIVDQLNSFTNRKQRIKILIRCIGSFMLLYHRIIEKRYAPEGVFEKEACKYWNPLFWNLSPKDTVKYISYVNSK